MGRARNRTDVVVRFCAHLVITENCWEWTGGKTTGYGRFFVGSKADHTAKQVASHRFAYELLVGPVPEGLDLDHLCRNRACCNPAHLEPVTRQENLLRGIGPVVQRARHRSKTHCKRGHPLFGDNLYLRPNERHCRTCEKARRQAARQRTREHASS